MKKIGFTWFIFLCVMLLTTCGCHSNCFKKTIWDEDCTPSDARNTLLRETWLCHINTNTALWTRCADHWFLTGEPNCIERSNLHAPASQTVSKMVVRVPNFCNISYGGDFQVQIIGHQDRNSVSIIGPHSAARRVSIEFYKNTLYVGTVKTLNGPCDVHAPMSQVIVRIGVRDLHSIKQCGCGTIYGRNISGRGLIINSSGRGDTMLVGVGDLDVASVTQTGSGTVTIINTCTPYLCLKVVGNGNVNISGRVGVQSIVHHGNGTVNIVGTDTDSLVINAAGMGLTNVVGFANLKRVVAIDCSQVYLYWVNSCGTYVCERNHAMVGLAGHTANLNVDLSDEAHFQGSYLHGGNVYVRTRDESHANVVADKRIFANADGLSSIYFYGTPTNVSRFMSGKGVVIPVWYNPSCAPCAIKARIATEACPNPACFKAECE